MRPIAPAMIVTAIRPSPTIFPTIRDHPPGKGTKKIFFKNFMDARVNNVILPISKRLMPANQTSKVSAEGFMATVVMHEICHAAL